MTRVIEKTDITALKYYIKEISGERNHYTSLTHLKRISLFLEEKFKKFGFDVDRQRFQNGPLDGINIIGNKSSSINSKKTLLITAHYDTVTGTPGANDNGSGLAGLLECARILGPLELKHNLRLIAFDMEEANKDCNGLLGSRAYVAMCKKNNEEIIGVLNFEMIGYTNKKQRSQRFPDGFDLLYPELINELKTNQFKADFLSVIADQNSIHLQQIFSAAAMRQVSNLKSIYIIAPKHIWQMPDLLRSDHTPFWENGYPALMLTDTANFRNPHYHKSTDTIDKLDFQFMNRVIRATLSTAIEILHKI